MRFESLTGRPLQLYVLADPAPGNDGNDDAGSAATGSSSATTTSRRAPSRPRPPSERRTSGYRGTASDPWIDLQDGHLSNYNATEQGNVVQGARTALNGRAARR